ncbi:hypothetical protein [Thauera sp. 63]|jgi:hypothetical protein|uniref:hypothetical protein n=1 Tax=Thauera sp. 63 TaxID=497321 RepID=UPI0002CD9658|nr:hypothetical protein [Thauera sp. 63]ENO79150.1 hypothetical protein C664_05446 [Thauera sp. 63]
MKQNHRPSCPACGSTEYEGELMVCPHCDSLKCSQCDMGDDTACIACEGEE